MLIRNFKTCSNEVKCHLFKTFCSNIYCSTLWCRFTDESMRRLKVAYNRIFRILIFLLIFFLKTLFIVKIKATWLIRI